MISTGGFSIIRKENFIREIFSGKENFIREIFSGSALLALALVQLSPVPAFGATETELNKDFRYKEVQDRTVDLAAISSYKSAVRQLKILVAKKKGSPQELDLLLRLAHTQHKAASVEFRIAHGMIAGKGKKPNLNNYHFYLNDSLKPLNRAIETYPNFTKVNGAYFLRAKTYKELGRRDAAIADLKLLVGRDARIPEVASAYLMLYDLMAETEQYREGMTYLSRLRVKPSDPHYTLVLDRFAWAHFHLDEIPQALKYLEYQVAFYRTQNSRTRALQGEKEKAYSAAALFYATAVEKRVPGFDPEGGLVFFQKLEKDRDLGRMLTHFSYLLRTRGLNDQLERFKDLVVTSPKTLPDSDEVILAAFGSELNRREMKLLQTSTSQLSDLLKRDKDILAQQAKREKIEQELSDAATRLQEFLALDKNDPYLARQTAAALVPVYHLLLDLPGILPPAVLKYRFNLAETSLILQDYEVANSHYQWILENEKIAADDAKLKKLVSEARFKLLSSRYEHLKKMKLIQAELKPVHVSQVKAAALPGEATQWIGWVRKYPRAENPEASDMFEFEANRLLYGQGHIGDALIRFVDFAKTNPKSKYAIPGAALVIDTYLASERWSDAYRAAAGFLTYADWKGTDFHKRLYDVASDTSFKMLELLYKEQKYAEAMDKSEKFLEFYPQSKHVESCLDLAANAALASKDRRRALQFFARKKDKGGAVAVLTHASIAEDDFDYPTAVNEFIRYLELPTSQTGQTPAERKDLQTKTVLYAWLSGNPKVLSLALTSKTLCASNGPKRHMECEKFEALHDLARGARFSSKTLMAKYEEAKQYSWKVVRAVMALARAKVLSIDDRVALLRYVDRRWVKVDNLTKMALIPIISDEFPRSMRIIRENVKASARIRLDDSAIRKRVKLVETTERSLTPLLDFPLSGIQVSALNEIAALYMDFYAGLDSIKIPRGLSKEDREAFEATLIEMKTPFREKGEQLRSKAFAQASEQAVDSDTFHFVFSRFVQEKPADASPLLTNHGGLKSSYLSSALVDDLESEGKWKKEPLSASGQWHQALKQKNFARAAFMLQLAKERQELSEGFLAVAQAVSFADAGAQAEAVALLHEALFKLNTVQQTRILVELVNRYYSSFAKAQAKRWIEELASGHSGHLDKAATGDDALLIMNAAEWAEAVVSSSFKERLARIAQNGGRVPAGGAQ